MSLGFMGRFGVVLCCAVMSSCGLSEIGAANDDLKILHAAVRKGDKLGSVVSRVADLHQRHSGAWLYVRAYSGPQPEQSLVWDPHSHPDAGQIERFEVEAYRAGNVQFAFRAGPYVSTFDVPVSPDSTVGAASPLKRHGS